MVEFLLCIIIWLLANPDCGNTLSELTREELQEMETVHQRKERIMHNQMNTIFGLLFYWIPRSIYVSKFGWSSSSIVQALDAMIGVFTLIVILIMFQKDEN